MFRGKRWDNEEWTFGDLNQLQDDCIIHAYEHCCRVAYSVNPYTIGQYTGLTDKNGEKIFEGDIARYDDELVVVEWAEDAAMFMVRAFYGGILIDFFQILGEDIEAIGNIHDNPKLYRRYEVNNGTADNET